jgi:hypothetical protein
MVPVARLLTVCGYRRLKEDVEALECLGPTLERISSPVSECVDKGLDSSCEEVGCKSDQGEMREVRKVAESDVGASAIEGRESQISVTFPGRQRLSPKPRRKGW